MKKNKLFFIIVCVALISAIGVFSFGMIGHTENGTCPISVFSNDECSFMDNTFAMASHHISGIQALSDGIITSSLGIILMLLSVVLVLLFIKPANIIDNLISNFRYINIKYKTYPMFLCILKWIALHNKLDTYAYSRASSYFRS
jgi:hypothetical protein